MKFENIEVIGLKPAIRGMRNPLNSWDKSDSLFGYTTKVGKSDMELALKLANAGTSHSKYRRMINVYVDITAPLYWWKQFDTYKVGTVDNSCSTMHKIAEKEFAVDDFSSEHLITIGDCCLSDGKEEIFDIYPIDVLNITIDMLNRARELYLETKDKKYWWQMIQLLPTLYNQKRTVMLNYEVLSNIYKTRKGHKLDEWNMFVDWIDTLPYSKIINGVEVL
jgi:hypothetical protein